MGFLKDLQVPEYRIFYCVFCSEPLTELSSDLVEDFRISLLVVHVLNAPEGGGAASFETSNYSSSDTASQSERRSTAMRTSNLAVN